MAGVNSTFSIQRRDIYGNLLSDMGEAFDVELTTSLAGTGEVYSIPPEWLSVHYAGAGVWQVYFYTEITGSYVLKAAIGTDEILKIEKTEEGDWVQVENSLDPETLLPTAPFIVVVGPSPINAGTTEARGNGLRGGIADGRTLSIEIISKDQLGNPREDTGYEQLAEAQNFELQITACPELDPCEGSVIRAPGNELVTILDVEPSPEPGHYIVSYIPLVDRSMYFMIDIRYKGDTISGTTDVEARSPEGTFLTLVPNAALEPDRVYARVSSVGGDPNPIMSQILTYEAGASGKVTYAADSVRNTAGDRLAFTIQVRTDENFDVETPGSLGRLQAELVDSLSGESTSRVSMSWNFDTAAAEPEDTPDYVTDNMDGSYTLEFPAADSASSASPLSLTRSGQLTLLVRGSSRFKRDNLLPLKGFEEGGHLVRVVPSATDVDFSDVLFEEDLVRVDPRMDDPVRYVLSPQGQRALLMEAGTNATLLLQSRDKFGNAAEWNKIIKGDPYRGVLEPLVPGIAKAANLIVQDREDGTYTVPVREPTVATSYKVIMQLGERTLPGGDGRLPVPSALFPFDSAGYYLPLVVEPSDLDISACTASYIPGQHDPSAMGVGVELDFLRVVVNSEGSLVIIEKDRFGNVRRTGESRFSSNFVPVERDPATKVWHSVEEQHTHDPSAEEGSLYSSRPGDAVHSIIFSAAAPDFYASYYRVTVGADEVSISGSPFVVQILPGEISLPNTIAYGPGLNWDNNAIQGTVRAGVEIEVLVQARDKFRNNLLTGGEEWLLLLQPIETGSLDTATSSPSHTGLYSVKYVATSSGVKHLQVQLQTQNLPTRQFLHQDSSGAVIPRPEGGLGYPQPAPGQDPLIVDFEDEPGVMVRILPGPLSPEKTFASDTLGAIKGGGRQGTMDAGLPLEFEIATRDVFNRMKVDVDTDRFLKARLEYYMDQNNQTSGIRPFNEKFPQMESLWSFSNDIWTSPVSLYKVEGESLYRVEEGAVPIMVVAGYYRLAIEVELYSESGTLEVSLPIGELDVASPYKIYVRPGVSSGSNTGLNLGDRLKRALGRFSWRGRSLLAHDEEEAADIYVKAGEEASLAVALKDSLGNAQQFDKFRKLDQLTVSVGETVREGSQACKWLQVEGSVMPTVDPSSDHPCTLVHTGWEALANGSVVPPDYGISVSTEVPGLDLRTENVISAGQFAFSFTPDMQLPANSRGSYSLEIKLNEGHIGGSPFRLRIEPGDIHGPASILQDGALSEWKVGEENVFGILARDVYGNAQLISDKAENFYVSLLVTKTSVGGSTVSSSGCTANSPAFASCVNMPIEVRGAQGNMTGGAYNVSVLTLISSGYSPSGGTEGDYSVSVRYCEVATSCSPRNNIYNPDPDSYDSVLGAYQPFTVRVNPAETLASESVVIGPDILEGSVVGQKSIFMIEARDSHGNRQLGGGELFSVYIYTKYGEQVPLLQTDPVDLGNGRYLCEFNPQIEGQYTILVLLGNSNVQGSPFEPIFRSDDGILVPEITRVVNGDGTRLLNLPKTVAGEDFTIGVQAYMRLESNTKAYGKREGGDLLFARIQPLSGSGDAKIVEVADETLGRYRLSVPGADLTEADTYRLRVTACPAFNGTCSGGAQPRDIMGSPFLLNVVAAEVDPDQSFAVELADPVRFLNNGDGFQAGKVNKFTVQAKDVFGNEAKYDPSNHGEEPATFDVAVYRASSREKLTNTEVNNPSELNLGEVAIVHTFESIYSVLIAVQESENYSVDVMYGGRRIVNGGVDIMIAPGDFSAPHSYVFPEFKEVDAGATQEFTIQTQDAFGNLLQKGGVNFMASIATTSPYQDSEGSGTNPLGAAQRIIDTDDFNTFQGTFQFKNKFLTKAELRLSDRGDGQYKAFFRMDRSGAARLSVTAEYTTADGEQVEGHICDAESARTLCGPFADYDPSNGWFNVVVRAGELNPDKSVAYARGTALGQVAAGANAEIEILPRDSLQNLLTTNGYLFQIRMQHQDSPYRLLGQTRFQPEKNVLRPAGSYYGRYRALYSGKYLFSIKYNGKPVPVQKGGLTNSNGTAEVDVVAAPTNGARSFIEHQLMTIGGEDALASTAGDPTTFSIYTSDAFGNIKKSGGEEFSVKIGPVAEARIKDNKNGTYTANYTMTVAGTYDMEVQVNGMYLFQPVEQYDVNKGAYVLNVMPGTAVAEKSTATGRGLKSGTAGDTMSFLATAFDTYGNRLSGSEEAFRATISAAAEGLSVGLPAKSNGDGSYSFNYLLEKSGSYNISVQLGSDAGEFSDVYTGALQVSPAPLSLLDSVVSGEGIDGMKPPLVLESSSVALDLRDSFGNNLTDVEIESFSVVVSSGTGSRFDFLRTDVAPGIVEENSGGAIRLVATYEPTIVGRHELSVLYLGNHLGGSPYPFVVRSAQVGVPAPDSHANRCIYAGACSYVEGHGLAEGFANFQKRFTIHSRDIYGNKIVTTDAPGLDGASSCGKDSSPACPFRVAIEQPGGLFISSLDKWKPGQVAGKQFLVEIKDNTDGTFDAVFKFYRSGIHTIQVSFHNPDQDELSEAWPTRDGRGTLLHGFPLTSTVLDVAPTALKPSRPEDVIVSGDGLLGGVAGEKNEILIQAGRTVCVTSSFKVGADGCSDPVRRAMAVGGEAFTIEAVLSSPSSGQNGSGGLNTAVLDRGDGTYLASYQATAAGQYTVRFLLDGQQFGEDRDIEVFPGPTSAEETEAYGIGEDVSVAGRRISFDLRARDRFGNLQKPKDFQLTKDAFEIDIGLRNATMTSADKAAIRKSLIRTDNLDGTWTFSFIARRAGSYDLGIQLFGASDSQDPQSSWARTWIGGSPYQQEVKAGAIGSSFTQLLSPDGGPASEVINTAEAKEELVLVVHAFDNFNNRIKSGGEGRKIFVQMVYISSNRAEQGEVVDNENGTYNVRFFPQLVGEYIVRLKVEDKTVLKDPSVDYTDIGSVLTIAAFAPLSIAEGSALNAGTAGDEATFDIQARDRDGQNKQIGGDIFLVNYDPLEDFNDLGIPLSGGVLRPADLGDAAGEDNNPGRYRVAYNIANFGRYRLSVRLQGEHIAGSPFDLEIGRRLPPVLGNIRFSNTATKIMMRFVDSEGNPVATNRGGLSGLDSCDKVLTTNTTAQLGSGALCSFSSPSALDVVLGFGAKIQAGDEVALRSDAVISDEMNSQFASGTGVVERPFLAPSPKAVVRAPVKLSLCDDFAIDASGSYGTAGRPLNFTYGVFPNVPNEDSISALLHEYSQTGTVKNIVVPKELLSLDTPYTFAVRITNFLKETTEVLHEVTRMPFAVPRVVIEGDPIVRTLRNKSLYLRSEVSVPTEGSPECTVPAPEMDFYWKFHPDFGGKGFILDSKTRSSKTLFVSPGSLEAGRAYRLQVEGSIAGQPELSNLASVAVEVRFNALQAALEAPKTLSVLDDVVLDASRSADPDDPSPSDPQTPFGPFMHYWSCLNATEEEATPQGDCFEDKFGLLFPDPTDRKLTLPAGTLRPGKYLFELQIMKEPLFSPSGSIPGRVVALQKVIEVKDLPEDGSARRRILDSVESRAPPVQIVPLMGSIVNSNERLALESSIPNRALYGDNIAYHWEILEGVLDLNGYPGVLATPRNSSNLVVRKNALTPGQTYKLALTATNTLSGQSSADDIAFSVNGPPSSGSFQIVPSVGYAASTRFTLSCLGWEDDGVDPVEFEFRYYDPTTGDQIPLVARSRTNEVSTFIPPVADPENGNQVIVSAFVVDFNNAKVQVNQTVVVNTPAYDDYRLDVEVACPPPENATEAVLNATEAASEGEERCVRTVQGGAVLAKELVDVELREAKGTNNVALLLTLAKSIMRIKNREEDIIAARPKPFVPEGGPVSAATVEQTAVDELALEMLSNQAALVMVALSEVIETVQVTKEELDAFGDTYRESLRNPSSVKGGDSSSQASSGILNVLDASVGTGLDDVAAQALLDSAGGLAEALESKKKDTVVTARQALLDPEHADSFASESSEDDEQARSVVHMVEKLSQAGIKDAVEGEDSFSVASKNVKVAAKRTRDPSGSFSPPAEAGGDASANPQFDIPPLAAGDGEAQLDVSTSVMAINPYQSEASNIQGNIVSFDIYAKGAASALNVSLAEDQEPILIKIPTQVSGSSCRQTSGSCRYWDEASNDWSTKGLFEKERTDDFILCESRHLSTFGVSGDDVVPEFNMVNPIADADLFTNINLDNSLAIFILGFIYAAFALANYYGYKLDVQQGRRYELEGKITALDARLSGEKLRRPSPLTPALGADAKTAPRKTLTQRITEKFQGQHLFATVFLVEPGDPFTRPQRLMVLLSVVLGQIAVTAVFFGLDPSNLAMKAVIGVLTAAAMLPPRVLLRMLFEKSTYIAPKVKKPKKLRQRAILATGELKPYVVKVKTSDMLNAGTRSTVSIEVHGELGRSENFELRGGVDSEGRPVKQPFSRDALDRFERTLPNLGRLKRIRVGHNGRGTGWHLDYVCVIDSNTGDQYTFACDSWLDKKLDGGYLVRSFELSAQDAVSLEDIQFSSRPATPQGEPAEGDGGRPPVSPDLRQQDYAADLEDVLPPPMTHFFPNRAPPPAGGRPAPPKPPAPPSGQKFRPRRRNKLGAAAAAVRAGLAFGSAAASPGGAMAPPPPAAGARPPRRPGIRAVPPGGASPGGGEGDVPTPEAKGRMRPKRRATMLQAIASAAGVTKGLVDGAEAQKARPRGLQRQGAGSAGRAARQKLVQALVDGRKPDMADVGAAASASASGGAGGLPAGSYVPPAVDIVIRKIQRAWKEKVRKRKQRELRAAARIQAYARGFLQRKYARQNETSKAQARSADGLWWLTAHSKRPEASAEALKSKWRVGAGAIQEINSDFGKRLMKDMDVEKIPRKRKKRKGAPTGLPRWFIYVTYTVAFLFCAACTYMITLFGLAFEPAISRAWLLSSMFAIFLELFVTNPLSLVVSAMGEAQLEKTLAKVQDRLADDEDFLDGGPGLG